MAPPTPGKVHQQCGACFPHMSVANLAARGLYTKPSKSCFQRRGRLKTILVPKIYAAAHKTSNLLQVFDTTLNIISRGTQLAVAQGEAQHTPQVLLELIDTTSFLTGPKLIIVLDLLMMNLETRLHLQRHCRPSSSSSPPIIVSVNIVQQDQQHLLPSYSPSLASPDSPSASSIQHDHHFLSSSPPPSS